MSRSKAQGKTPNDHNIKAQIKALVDIKPTVLRRSAFGDDHHAAIDAQVKVLERRMTEDQVWNYFDGDPDNVRDAALDAARWLRGKLEDSPDLVEPWKELVR